MSTSEITENKFSRTLPDLQVSPISIVAPDLVKAASMEFFFNYRDPQSVTAYRCYFVIYTNYKLA